MVDWKLGFVGLRVEPHDQFDSATDDCDRGAELHLPGQQIPRGVQAAWHQGNGLAADDCQGGQCHVADQFHHGPRVCHVHFHPQPNAEAIWGGHRPEHPRHVRDFYRRHTGVDGGVAGTEDRTHPAPGPALDVHRCEQAGALGGRPPCKNLHRCSPGFAVQLYGNRANADHRQHRGRHPRSRPGNPGFAVGGSSIWRVHAVRNHGGHASPRRCHQQQPAEALGPLAKRLGRLPRIQPFGECGRCDEVCLPGIQKRPPEKLPTPADWDGKDPIWPLASGVRNRG